MGSCSSGLPKCAPVLGLFGGARVWRVLSNGEGSLRDYKEHLSCLAGRSQLQSWEGGSQIREQTGANWARESAEPPSPPSPSQAQPSSLPGKSPRCKREAYKGEATSTWPIEGVVESIVVVPVEEGEADVSRAVLCLPEEQGGHVAPELEGGSDGQAHLVLGQVGRPVHHPVRQVPLGPAPTCNGTSSATATWARLATQGLPGWRKTSWKCRGFSQDKDGS